MEPRKTLTRYEAGMIQKLEDDIQFHESMKALHDEAIAKARVRIDTIEFEANQRAA